MSKGMQNIRISDVGAIVRHNETDYANFKDLKDSIDNNADRVRKKLQQEKRRESLEEWVQSVPKRWKKTSLNTIDSDLADKAKALLAKGPRSIFISGGNIADMDDLSYAICRRFVGGGVATYSQIQFLTEEQIVSWAKRGFEGQKEIDATISSNGRIFVISGIVRDRYDLGKEGAIFKRIFETCYRNDGYVIISSSVSLSEFMLNLEDSADILEEIFQDREISLDEDDSEDQTDLNPLDLFKK